MTKQVTIRFKPRGSKKWRRYPEPRVAEIQSWFDLEGFLKTACMGLYADPKCGQPTEFTFEGVEHSDWDPKAEDQEIFEITVTYLALTHDVIVTSRWFHYTLRSMKEDLELWYRHLGHPLKDPARHKAPEPTAPPEVVNLKMASRVSAPPPNEYACMEMSGIQRTPHNEWETEFLEEEETVRRNRLRLHEKSRG